MFKPYKEKEPAVEYAIGSLLGFTLMMSGFWLALHSLMGLATAYGLVGAGIVAYSMANYIIRKL